MSRQIIPSSKVADGQNITIDGGAISFHVASWLSEDNLERGLRWTCQVSPPRDISYAVNAENMVIMRDIQMRYPGGDMSTLFPVANAIIEYRPSIGRVSKRRNRQGKSEFDSGYMVTYASVGVPTAVFQSLVASIQVGSGQATVDVPKLQENDGYSWMPMKIPPPSSPLKAYALLNQGEADAGQVSELLKVVEESLLCYVTLSVRLKHTRARTAPDSRRFDLAATVTSCQIIATTKLCSPPLNSNITRHLVDIRVSQELEEILSASIEGRGGDEVEEVDADGTVSKPAPV